MKFVFLIVVALLPTDPLKTGRINSVKAEAKKAFQSGDYKTAAEKYHVLIDSMGVKDDAVLLNLAHAYYLQKDTARAQTQYQPLTQSPTSEIASKANNQLGLLTNQQGKAQEALAYFKQAIKADPGNEDARYNYEMLKKKLDKKKQEDQKKNQDKNDKNKKPEPTEFAKDLKRQADQLVQQHRYNEAYNLMAEGAKKDQTVSPNYQTFIDRTKTVAEINQ